MVHTCTDYTLATRQEVDLLYLQNLILRLKLAKLPAINTHSGYVLSFAKEELSLITDQYRYKNS